MKVCTYLDTSSLLPLSAVSKQFSSFAKSNDLWEVLWMEHFSETWFCEEIEGIRRSRGIHWDPRRSAPPTQGWFRFYLEFEFAWVDWLLAGFCTEERCLVSLHGAILDITNFIHDHPGSPESLTEHSGGDATDTFTDIGHSSLAQRLAKVFVIWEPKEHRYQDRISGCPQPRDSGDRGLYESDSAHRVIDTAMSRVTRFHQHMRSIQTQQTRRAQAFAEIRSPNNHGAYYNQYTQYLRYLDSLTNMMPQIPQMPNVTVGFSDIMSDNERVSQIVAAASRAREVGVDVANGVALRLASMRESSGQWLSNGDRDRDKDARFSSQGAALVPSLAASYSMDHVDEMRQSMEGRELAVSHRDAASAYNVGEQQTSVSDEDGSRERHLDRPEYASASAPSSAIAAVAATAATASGAVAVGAANRDRFAGGSAESIVSTGSRASVQSEQSVSSLHTMHTAPGSPSRSSPSQSPQREALRATATVVPAELGVDEYRRDLDAGANAEAEHGGLSHHGVAGVVRSGRHVGRVGVFFDPLRRQWVRWWTCCGLSYDCHCNDHLRLMECRESKNLADLTDNFC
jgi:hypothetical protein